MTRIASDFFSESPVLLLPLLALFLFLAVFIAVSVRAARMQRGAVEALARMPLEDQASDDGAVSSRETVEVSHG